MNVRVEILWLVQMACLILNEAVLKIELERAEVFKSDPKYIHKHRVWVSHYNRTQKVMNGQFNLKRPLRDDSKFVVECLKFFSNEYRNMGIKFGLNVKDVILEQDPIKLLSLVDRNVWESVAIPILTWPLKTNFTYRLRSLNPDFVHPPDFSEGRYLIKFSLYLDNQQTLIVTCGVYAQATKQIVY